jgi:hypothetical protein
MGRTGWQLRGLPTTLRQYLDLIAATTNIPKRILLGSERGELASTQDSENWNAFVEERQSEHCEPRIVRPFVTRLVDVGVLPAPTDCYEVRWPSLSVQGKKEGAEIGKLKTETLATYSGSTGAEGIVPPEIFLKSFLGMSNEEITQIDAVLAVQDAEVEREDAAAEEAAAEMAAETAAGEAEPTLAIVPPASPPRRPPVGPRLPTPGPRLPPPGARTP